MPGTWLRLRWNRTLILLQRWRLQPIEPDDALVLRLRRLHWNAAQRSLPTTPYAEAGYSRPQMPRGRRVRRSAQSRCSPGPTRSSSAHPNGLHCSTCAG